MCNNASTFDSMLAVYEDAGCTNLASRLMICNNDGAGAGCTGGRAEVAFNIVSGRNYTVRVGGAGVATGTGTMTLSCVPHCRGDWNGDGIITPVDVSAYVNDWFASLTGGRVVMGLLLAMSFLDDLDGEFRAVRLGEPRLLFQFRRYRAVADLARIAQPI